MSERRRTLPFEGDVVAALFRLSLAEALRRGRSSEGIEVRPLRQVLFASTFLGIFCALPLHHQESAYWVEALFAYVAFYTGLAILPDPTDAFERRRDVLGALPIRPVDAALARVGFLAVLVTLLVVPLALPSLVGLALRGDVHPLRLIALLPAMLMLGLTVSCTWLFFAFKIGGWLGVDRLRKTASLGLSLMVAGSSILGTSAIWSGRLWPPGFGADLLALSPTSWLAAPLLPVHDSLASTQALAAVALFAFSLVLAARTDPVAAYGNPRSATRAPRDTVTCVLLARLERLRFTARSSQLPLVLFLSRVWSRDPFTRMRVRAFLTSFAAFLAISWFWHQSPVALPLLAATLGFMALADGSFDLAMSGDSAAVWLLDTQPIPSDRLLGAMRATVVVGRGLLPTLVLGVVAARADGLPAGVVLALGFAGVSYLLVTVLLLVRPRRPFGQQSSTARGSTAIWLSSPLAFAGVLALSPAFLLAQLPAFLGVPGVAALALTAYAFGRALGFAAARRLDRLPRAA